MPGKFLFYLLVIGFCLIAAAPPARAQQAPQLNFSMTPPPLVWPTFDRGVTMLKVRPSYSRIDGRGIAVQGAGFESIVRSSFSDQLAADVQIGLFGMEGSTNALTLFTGALSPTNSNITAGQLLLGSNAEMLLFRRNGASALLFAGPEMSALYGTVRSTWAPAGSSIAVTDTGTLSGYLYGVQGGGAAGVDIGVFHVGGYAGVLRELGRETVSWPSMGKFGEDIPSTTVLSYGLDFIYLPWNITAGILIQTKESHGQFQAVRTHIYHISWTF